MMTSDEMAVLAMMRGSIATAAVLALLVTVSALLYTGRIGRGEESGCRKLDILLEAARPWRFLAGVNLLALAGLCTTYLLWFFFAGPRPFLEPPYINTLFVASFYISLLHIAFPAVVLFSYGVRLRKERGQSLVPCLLTRR